MSETTIGGRNYFQDFSQVVGLNDCLRRFFTANRESLGASKFRLSYLGSGVSNVLDDDGGRRPVDLGALPTHEAALRLGTPYEEVHTVHSMFFKVFHEWLEKVTAATTGVPLDKLLAFIEEDGSDVPASVHHFLAGVKSGGSVLMDVVGGSASEQLFERRYYSVIMNSIAVAMVVAYQQTALEDDNDDARSIRPQAREAELLEPSFSLSTSQRTPRSSGRSRDGQLEETMHRCMAKYEENQTVMSRAISKVAAEMSKASADNRAEAASLRSLLTVLTDRVAILEGSVRQNGDSRARQLQNERDRDAGRRRMTSTGSPINSLHHELTFSASTTFSGGRGLSAGALRPSSARTPGKLPAGRASLCEAEKRQGLQAALKSRTHVVSVEDSVRRSGDVVSVEVRVRRNGYGCARQLQDERVRDAGRRRLNSTGSPIISLHHELTFSASTTFSSGRRLSAGALRPSSARTPGKLPAGRASLCAAEERQALRATLKSRTHVVSAEDSVRWSGDSRARQLCSRTNARRDRDAGRRRRLTSTGSPSVRQQFTTESEERWFPRVGIGHTMSTNELAVRTVLLMKRAPTSTSPARNLPTMSHFPNSFLGRTEIFLAHIKLMCHVGSTYVVLERAIKANIANLNEFPALLTATASRLSKQRAAMIVTLFTEHVLLYYVYYTVWMQSFSTKDSYVPTFRLQPVGGIGLGQRCSRAALHQHDSGSLTSLQLEMLSLLESKGAIGLVLQEDGLCGCA